MKLSEDYGILFDVAYLTDKGRVRANNEDCLWVMDKQERRNFERVNFGIYLVADGMGGHQAGEVASKLAIDIVSSNLLKYVEEELFSRSPSESITHAVNGANREIYTLAANDKEFYSMGTTITLGLRMDDELYLGHVGDSRAYLLRGGRIKQLTHDHSLVASLVKEGAITAAEAKCHPQRAKVLRSLGVACEVPVDITTLTLLKGDKVVLCSDGLTGSLTDNEINQCVLNSDRASQACTGLVNLANAMGGSDNISVIVISC